MRNVIILLGIAAASLAGGAAFAHTLVLERRGADSVPAFAHDGVLEAIAGDRIVRALAVGPDQRVAGVPIIRNRQQASIAVPADATALAVRYLGLPAGRAADGTRKVGSRVQNPDVPEVIRSEVDTVAVLRPGLDPAALPAVPLQLVPLQEVAGVTAGATVRVRVTLDGEPLAGVMVRLDALSTDVGGPTATTGADGVAAAVVPRAGLNLFVVSQVIPAPADPEAHVIRRQASLSFEAVAAPAR